MLDLQSIASGEEYCAALEVFKAKLCARGLCIFYSSLWLRCFRLHVERVAGGGLVLEEFAGVEFDWRSS